MYSMRRLQYCLNVVGEHKDTLEMEEDSPIRESASGIIERVQNSRLAQKMLLHQAGLYLQTIWKVKYAFHFIRMRSQHHQT